MVTRDSAARINDPTPSAGTANGNDSGRGYQRAPTPANGQPGHPAPDDGPVRSGPEGSGAVALQQARRDREVPGEIDERPIPAEEQREGFEAEARPERRGHRLAGRARHPDRERPARDDLGHEVTKDRCHEGRVTRRDRPDPA